MKVVISQPRYLPAINYLQRLFFADKFIIFDVVQRQARGWENRNKLLLPDPVWLTIPITSSSRALIADTRVDGMMWIKEHKEKIRRWYKTAPYFSEELLERAYEINGLCDSYRDLLVVLLNNACHLLSFQPKLILASELFDLKSCSGGGAQILREICEVVGAQCYVSGPNGRQYGVEAAFADSEIDLKYHIFEHPVYSQGKQTFVPYMGYLDALFYCGVSWLANSVRIKPEFGRL